ncbi:MAG: RimK family alpha-L-glutamate ligase [Halobacteriota archaeon]
MPNPNQNTKGAKIGVVLTDPDDWTASAFLKAIEKRGAKALPINLSTLSASISGSDFSIFDADLKALELDAILVRDVGISFALEQISFKFDLLRQFENSMTVMNSPTAIQNAANKFFSFYLFKLARLPIPRTMVTSELEVAKKTIEKFGSAVVKPIFGSQGKGIIKLESSQPESELASKLAELLKERGVHYLQQFVPNPGRDIRVFVVGEEALSAIYRVPRSGSFVSNLSQGATPVKCELTDEMRELAISAAKAVGADFAGVDLIEGEEGLFLLEVNATPSGKGIKLACGIDVTGRIVDRLFERLED